MKVTLLLAVLAMTVLHNDWLLPAAQRNGDHAVLGWLPVDVAYHLLWVVAGMIVCHFLLKATWGKRS